MRLDDPCIHSSGLLPYDLGQFAVGLPFTDAVLQATEWNPTSSDGDGPPTRRLSALRRAGHDAQEPWGAKCIYGIRVVEYRPAYRVIDP